MNERALNTPTCGRRLFSTLLAIVSITATFGCASSAPPAIPDPTPPPASETALGSEIERIERYVEDRMESQGTVGLTIGFIKGDQMWVHGFGYADLENGVAAIPESSYRMASVTKPMTAIGILTLVEAGKVDLDAEVQTYVPYFPKKEYPITIRQLLGHLGGITHYRNYDLEGHFKEPKNTREAIAVFEDFDLVAEPGTRYSYTSYGFNLLGAVIEGASGQSYGEYMTEHVWKPLGMLDTRMDDPRAIIPNRVEGYELLDGELQRSEYVDISSRFAGGGTRSTVPDMLAFAQGLWEGKLLNDDTRSRMWTAQSTTDGRNVGYGFGWGTNTANGRFVVGHGGSQAETRTYLLIAPHEHFAVAVATNHENTNPSAFAFRTFEIVMDEPWAIRYWAGDTKDRTVIRGLDNAFDFGMRYYDQFGEPLTTDPEELAAAFAYLDEAVSSPPEKAAEMLSRGVHPATGEPLVAVISWMADVLDGRGKDLDSYYDHGVLPLLRDFSGIDGGSDRIALDAGFVSSIQRFASDWERTWTAETRDLTIDSGTDLERLVKTLTEMFAGATVYPDFTTELETELRAAVVDGDIPKAFSFARAAVDLYPDSDETTANLAVLHILTGDAEGARPLIRKSLEIDPEGGAGAVHLNVLAYELANAGKPEAGLQLLMAATEIHPNVANLYDSIGEFHFHLGNQAKSIEFYSRALEIDPEYPNAEAARKRLEALRSQ